MITNRYTFPGCMVHWFICIHVMSIKAWCGKTWRRANVMTVINRAFTFFNLRRYIELYENNAFIWHYNAAQQHTIQQKCIESFLRILIQNARLFFRIVLLKCILIIIDVLNKIETHRLMTDRLTQNHNIVLYNCWHKMSLLTEKKCVDYSLSRLILLDMFIWMI